jgi:hypothetical protein
MATQLWLEPTLSMFTWTEIFEKQSDLLSALWTDIPGSERKKLRPSEIGNVPTISCANVILAILTCGVDM